jgi:hypothetical protein
VAGLRLDAAQRHHEAAPRVAPVGAQREHAREVERVDHLAGRADLDALAQAGADQRVVHQVQAFLQRRAHVVGELHRRGAGAAFGAVDHDVVGRDAGLQHGLDDAEPLPDVADAQLEAHRLAARQLAQAGDELHQLDRRENALCAEARCSPPHRHAARGGDLGRHLGARQHAAVAGLGALAELDLDHLDLRVARLLGKALGVEAAVRRCGSRSSPSRSPRSGRRRARGGSG